VSFVDSVEAIPVDIFGTVGTLFVDQNHMKAARTRLTVVESDGHIYVVRGSTDGTAPRGSFERGKILTDVDASQVNDPTIAEGTPCVRTRYV